MEKFDTLGELGHGFEPVVGILDADHRRLDALTLEFLEKLAGLSGSAAPGDVVAVFASFMEVVHLDGEDAVFQEANGFDRIDAVAQPIAEVGRGADTFAAVFA